jgi:hypothetical protein
LNAPAEILVDGVRYVPERPLADRVSIWGMYDMHLFHRIKGCTVDEVIDNWLAHNRKKQPAIVGDCEVDDMGQSSLCPATVLCGDKELRSVGKMVFPNYDKRGKQARPEELEAYRAALKADPDIERLLRLHGDSGL